MLNATRDEDGTFRLVGHPGILRILWTIPGTLRKIIEDPDANAKATKCLFPDAFSDPTAQAEHARLLGDDLKIRQLQKLAVFERVITSSDAGEGAIRIPEADFDAFLAVLTDLRLVLAVDIGIESDGWEELYDEDELDDPRIHLLNLIGGMQQLLLEATGLVDIELNLDDTEGT